MMKLSLSLAPMLVAGALTAGAAAAHSTMQETTPADGATLASAPERIEMRFDASMRLTLVRLTDESGAEMPLEPSRALTPVTVFSAAPGALPSGRYKVEWRGLAADGHPMDGVFSFSVR